jgi:hypothetical protein
MKKSRIVAALLVAVTALGLSTAVATDAARADTLRCC